jgi:hypothetical protein
MSEDCSAKTGRSIWKAIKAERVAVQSGGSLKTAHKAAYGFVMLVGGGKRFVKDGVHSSNPAVSSQGTVQLVTTATLTKLGDGGYQAVAVINEGTCTVKNVYLNTVMLGAANGSQVPQSFIDIPPSGHVTTTISFPANAGVSGTATSRSLQKEQGWVVRERHARGLA